VPPAVPVVQPGPHHGTNLTAAESVAATLKTNGVPLTSGNQTATVPPAVPTGPDDGTNLTEAESVLATLKANGLQLASSNQVAAWFADPRRQTHQIVFVDARNEDDFKGGHIPGAWLFNPYEEDKYAATVVPVCQAAEVVLVYCNGGECDDSLSAAVKLRERGIPNPKLYVYAAGMTEWLTSGRPVETGPRDSGQFPKTAQ
jgi:rhodanese-related sulfurtransferase